MTAPFSASRGAVREAFPQLEQLGIIAVQSGGARMRALSSAGTLVLRLLIARGVFPGPVLVRQLAQTFASLDAHNARDALACADAEQMNCIVEMVVISTGQRRYLCCVSQVAAAFIVSRDNA